ncbi:3013_t:CDS:2 [Funneliformis geosporum]|nr:3013_t:CDS:2 [Funneliformis geosporum]
MAQRVYLAGITELRNYRCDENFNNVTIKQTINILLYNWIMDEIFLINFSLPRLNLMDDQKTMQAIQVVQQRQPRPRFHFTEEHLSLLEGIYQQAKYPDKSQKVKAAAAIGATESQVNEWFQRRRKKEMKLQRESGVTNTPTATATATVPFINVTAENNNELNTETTSTYFPPFDGSVNASIPDHEVYVYIDAPQQNQENMYGNYGSSNSNDNNIIASVKIDEESRKASSSTSSNQTAENNESRELIASIMSYLNPDLGLISADVVRDFLKKVKDTSPNTRGVILHIIKQTHDLEILKSLVRERVSYILRNWIKEEATKTDDSNNLKELLEIVSLLPIDYKLSRSSGLGTVIYNKNVKESTIDGVAKLAGGLLDKWVEEKKLSEELQLKEQKVLEEKKRLDKAEKIGQKVGSKSDLIKSSTSQTSSVKELVRPPKPEQKRKKVTDGNAQNDNEKPSIFTQLLSNLAASASKRQTPRPPQKDPSKLVPPSKLKIEKQVTQSQQMEISEDGPSTQKHKETEILPIPSKKRKRVTFAPDGLLEKVKLFETMELDDTDEEHTTADTPHHYGNARDLDRNEGRAAFKRVRKAPAIQWHTPITIDFSSRPKIKKRKVAESDEARIQEERERQILETIYITSDQVPFSPAEPLQNSQINKFNQSVLPKELFLEENKENFKNDGYKDIDILDLNGGYNEEVLRVLYQIYPQWEAMQNKKSMMFPINVPEQNVRGMIFSAPPPQSQAAPPLPIAPWGFNGNTYETELNEYDKQFEKLLNELSWDLENVKIQQQRVNALVNCPFNPAHRIPSKSFERHYRKCELKFHGIHSELGRRKQLPSSNFYYQNTTSVISLNKEIKEGSLPNNNVQSLTVDQRLQEYESEVEKSNQIREQLQQEKQDLYQNFDQVWEAVQKMKEQNQGHKTREELLAEQRDYKRRRKSYRAKNIKITQRTPTQIHKDLIEAYMEDFKLLTQFEMNKQDQNETASPPNPSRYPY